MRHTLDIRQAPQYLIAFMDNLEEITTFVDTDKISTIGRDLLQAKVNSVIEERSAQTNNRGGALPKRLSNLEISLVLTQLLHVSLVELTSSPTALDKPPLYIYDGNPNSDRYGLYINAESPMAEYAFYLEPRRTRQDMKEILELSGVLSGITKLTLDRNIIVAKNGIYNKQTKVLSAFTPDRVFTTKLAINLVPDAQKPIIEMPDGLLWDVDDWLDDMTTDPDELTLLWQVLSASFQPNRIWGKSIWLYSREGNNGKGTFGQLIKNIVGAGNYSSLSVAQFKDTFSKTALLSSSVNICDENDADVYIDSVSDFKASITGDDIIINIKHRDAITFKYHGLNIQMLNGLPKTKDKTGSFYRRIIILPFTKSFTNNGERKYIKHDYINREDVLEYVLAKAVLVDDFDEFIEPEQCTQLLSQYELDNNPVNQFWDEFRDQFVWDLLPYNFTYDLFRSWSKRTNPSGKPMQRNTFIAELATMLKYDEEWTCGEDSQITTATRITKEEPLIREYELWSWLNDRGRFDIDDIKRTYRGFVKTKDNNKGEE